MAIVPTQPTPPVTRKAALLPAPVVGLVQSLVPDCTSLLPTDISSEQFRAALWLELTGRPDLHDCTPQSLRECIVKAATYGLLPGRDCHFLPFRNRRGGNKLATYVPNYQGIILALERTGKVRRAFAHPVHRGDLWEYDYFSDRPIHRPAVTLGKDPGPELFYYGAIQFKDGTFAVEVVTLEDLDKIRRSSPAHESGPWVDWPVMMKQKSAIKRVAKYVRLTPEVAALLEDDDEREQQDIPLERHAQNITDLFGDDPRGSTPPSRTHVPTMDIQEEFLPPETAQDRQEGMEKDKDVPTDSLTPEEAAATMQARYAKHQQLCMLIIQSQRSLKDWLKKTATRCKLPPEVQGLDPILEALPALWIDQLIQEAEDYLVRYPPQPLDTESEEGETVSAFAVGAADTPQE